MTVSRNGKMIITLMLIPSMLFGLAMLFYYYFNLGESDRINFIVVMLLAIIFLLVLAAD